ncbi:hypothetical protein HaLaN_32532, partial [Haematococcus lacustris]
MSSTAKHSQCIRSSMRLTSIAVGPGDWDMSAALDIRCRRGMEKLPRIRYTALHRVH